MNLETQSWCIEQGDVLVDGHFFNQPLYFHGQTISGGRSPHSRIFDASGLYIVPGIVDIHGDGFERNISPRPGVFFDVDAALLETDKQLLCNGITTAYLAMTISWEPGLRSLPKAIEIVDAVTRLKDRFITDIRLQLRWEIAAVEAVPNVVDWLHSLPLPTLAINDHFTQLLVSNKAHKIPEYAKRAGLDESDYLAKMKQATSQTEEIDLARKHLISAARNAGVSVFSHDEPDARVRQLHRNMGITVCEFPLTRETATDARTNNEPVILGAPNVVRGGSHIGAMDASTAIEDDLCNILASDYYYPALLKAVAKLADNKPDEIAKSWPLISRNPAVASNLTDRGLLEEGCRADALAVSLHSGQFEIEAVFIGGKPIFIADASRTGP